MSSIHSGVNQQRKLNLQCNQCHKHFKDSYNLNWHMSNVHQAHVKRSQYQQSATKNKERMYQMLEAF